MVSELVCATCHAAGQVHRTGPGIATFLLGAVFMVIGWVVVWPVGLLFMIALATASTARKKVCGTCGAATLIPGDSPRGRELLQGRQPPHP